MVFLDDRTRADRLVADVSQDIIDGAFAPGERLDELSLAERYGVSRTPVREALRRLASSGLVDVRPRRGAVVASITPAKLAELFGAMAELEATCARLAAIGMSPLERRRLEDFHASMAPLADADDADGFAAANLTFHSQIYAGAHNGHLAEIAAGLRARLLPYRRAQFRTPGRLPRSHAEHGVVVAAILAADAAEAHTAMLRHVSLVEDSFERLAALQPATRRAVRA
ncbi:GntR family transcriptional regulator [Hansschlegelia zhihuaiae]|uniref:GntR family transcriptional regulator n=1 Tax=Hansschlegelia zhihuaiae TaxID=405005 RepID=A0A4Q0MI32_9HYPH|nr:GntR family transcriptional regulator [Hansschlegelia zhihuaiae]RXF72656.1 GntR family transcriptional regulator [Hansschlegelia zhihuaiae]